MNVSCIQIDPEFKNKHKSIERAELILNEIAPGQPVDLIVLPEMALIGYKFEDRQDIAPFVERVPSDLDTIFATLDDIDAEEA